MRVLKLNVCLLVGFAGVQAQAHPGDHAHPHDRPPLWRADADGDGFIRRVDCDDADPGVNPDAEESESAGNGGVYANGVDEDCNGVVDQACPGASLHSMEGWDGWIPAGQGYAADWDDQACDGESVGVSMWSFVTDEDCNDAADNLLAGFASGVIWWMYEDGSISYDVELTVDPSVNGVQVCSFSVGVPVTP